MENFNAALEKTFKDLVKSKLRSFEYTVKRKWFVKLLVGSKFLTNINILPARTDTTQTCIDTDLHQHGLALCRFLLVLVDNNNLLMQILKKYLRIHISRKKVQSVHFGVMCLCFKRHERKIRQTRPFLALHFNIVVSCDLKLWLSARYIKKQWSMLLFICFKPTKLLSF